MQVDLVSHTQNAVNLLLFTKNTRLEMTPGAMAVIADWSEEKKQKELAYMANSLPSSWEFVDYVFSIQGVSRAFTHQLVRTRTGSYAQQAMRVVDKSDGFEYVFTDRDLNNPRALAIIGAHREVTQSAYRQLIDAGQLPEDARGVLPTNVGTNIIAKFNLRTMADLAAVRSGGRTQSEYQRVLAAMCDRVIEVHPWAEQFMFNRGRDYFSDIEAFATREYADDLFKKGELLKIVDKMRKEKK